MKLIIAYVQPEQLNEVKQSLYEKEVYKMSVTNAMGCGQQKGYTETYRGVEIEVNLLKKVRIEIGQRFRFFLNDRGERLHRCIALKGPLAGRHFVEDDSEREHIGTVVDRFTLSLLR